MADGRGSPSLAGGEKRERDEFSESDSDDDIGTGQKPIIKPPVRNRMLFDPKWKGVLNGDNPEDFPHITSADAVRAMGVLMARMEHLEKCARDDRKQIEFLQTERRNHMHQIQLMDATIKAGFDNCYRLPEVPPHELIMDKTKAEPRDMVLPEKKRLELALRKLKDGGKRAEEVSRIAGVVPDVNQHVKWELPKWSPRTKWQVYYYLRFSAVRKRIRLPDRAQQTQDAITAAGGIVSSEVDSERAEEEEWMDDEEEEED